MRLGVANSRNLGDAKQVLILLFSIPTDHRRDCQALASSICRFREPYPPTLAAQILVSLSGFLLVPGYFR
jgi:hypothetical protein